MGVDNHRLWRISALVGSTELFMQLSEHHNGYVLQVTESLT